MIIFKSIGEWRKFRKSLAKDDTLGFVPTMGNLHVGHESLLLQSIAENDKTVLSIFVNPTQFNNKNDIENYPRSFEQDVQWAQRAGVNFILAPSEQEIYPDHYRYKINESLHTQILEGKYRPGHFEGVLTIVMKLLMLVQPERAYFGEKDYQQLQLIRELVEAFFIDTEIVSCPTIRNENGLPHSSRNNRFSEEQFQQVQQFPQIFHLKRDCKDISLALSAAGFDVEYVEDFENRRFAAVRFAGVRLIDNIALTETIDMHAHPLKENMWMDILKSKVGLK
jgi:pantoate--beta-alanine ligase